jgi:methylase of polypeptide subunit release factors
LTGSHPKATVEESKTYQIGGKAITLTHRDGAAPATPYSLLLAECIPDLSGQTVVDLGTGSGILAIVAMLRGAERVYLIDSFDEAIALALENARRNGVEAGLVHLPIGESLIPLPRGERVDYIISNPAQLPLPQMEIENSPFYAAPDGRAMIDPLITEAASKLAPRGGLLMTHNSLTNLPKSLARIEELGMESRIVAERTLAFRPFIDRDWLDTLGGAAEGLYFVRDGLAYEKLCVVEARRRG